MNILIRLIFKAEQAFYATTIRFFPTLAINQGLLSDWNDSRLTSELNQYRKTCRELKELLNRTQQLPGFQGQQERWLTRAEDKEYIRTQQKLVRVEDHNRKARSEARQKRSNAYDELVKFFVRHPDLWKMVTEVTWELLQSHSLIYLLNAVISFSARWLWLRAITTPTVHTAVVPLPVPVAQLIITAQTAPTRDTPRPAPAATRTSTAQMAPTKDPSVNKHLHQPQKNTASQPCGIFF